MFHINRTMQEMVNRTMQEMEIFQRRCFRTIGISQARAELQYGVPEKKVRQYAEANT